MQVSMKTILITGATKSLLDAVKWPRGGAHAGIEPNRPSVRINILAVGAGVAACIRPAVAVVRTVVCPIGIQTGPGLNDRFADRIAQWECEERSIVRVADKRAAGPYIGRIGFEDPIVIF